MTILLGRVHERSASHSWDKIAPVAMLRKVIKCALFHLHHHLHHHHHHHHQNHGITGIHIYYRHMSKRNLVEELSTTRISLS